MQFTKSPIRRQEQKSSEDDPKYRRMMKEFDHSIKNPAPEAKALAEAFPLPK